VDVALSALDEPEAGEVAPDELRRGEVGCRLIGS
jgi:hypothetical protein